METGIDTTTQLATHVLAMFLGVFMPIIVAYVKTPSTSRTAGALLALGTSLVVGAVSGVATGQIDVLSLSIDEPGTVLTATGLAFTSATMVYQTYFKGTETNQKLERAGWEPPANPPG